MTRRHAWKKVDMSGDRWKAEDSVMFFIYTSVFIVTLVSKKNRPKLLAVLPPLSFRCRIFFYLNYLTPAQCDPTLSVQEPSIV